MATVLVADDDVDHRELLALALRREGHVIVDAVDAQAAFVLLSGGGVDAALLDVRMPGESGIELCRRLRAEPVTAVLPVMMISADVNDNRILEALRAGADDFLSKPFHRAELCARLDNLLLHRKVSAAKASAAAARAASYAIRPAVAVSQDAAKSGVVGATPLRRIA